MKKLESIVVSLHTMNRETSNKFNIKEVQFFVEKVVSIYTMLDAKRKHGFYKLMVYGLIIVLKKEQGSDKKHVIIRVITIYERDRDCQVMLNIDLHGSTLVYQGDNEKNRKNISVKRFKSSYKKKGN